MVYKEIFVKFELAGSSVFADGYLFIKIVKIRLIRKMCLSENEFSGLKLVTKAT